MSPVTLVRWIRDRHNVLRDGHNAPRDHGISTIEVVILAPVMMMFILVLVGFGQLVEGRGAVDGAARDAARAGSIQHVRGTAVAQAEEAAKADLEGVCTGPVQVTAGGDWEPGGVFTIEVSCEIRALSMIGLDIPTSLTGKGASPIDPYKRVEG
ncbi:TadE/TadG family type IV pilus assembly protein [Streptomyces boninensis]|uniref:TadE/TadG family type IV pilus assembly protein n=1 Tax=Streptomyces boninensis TaxID=2039455 RepID=UPI003B219654